MIIIFCIKRKIMSILNLNFHNWYNENCIAWSQNSIFASVGTCFSISWKHISPPPPLSLLCWCIEITTMQCVSPLVGWSLYLHALKRRGTLCLCQLLMLFQPTIWIILDGPLIVWYVLTQHTFQHHSFPYRLGSLHEALSSVSIVFHS